MLTLSAIFTVFMRKNVQVLYIILLTFPPNSAILTISVSLETLESPEFKLCYAGLNSDW